MNAAVSRTKATTYCCMARRWQRNVSARSVKSSSSAFREAPIVLGGMDGQSLDQVPVGPKDVFGQLAGGQGGGEKMGGESLRRGKMKFWSEAWYWENQPVT